MNSRSGTLGWNFVQKVLWPVAWNAGLGGLKNKRGEAMKIRNVVRKVIWVVEFALVMFALWMTHDFIVRTRLGHFICTLQPFCDSDPVLGRFVPRGRQPTPDPIPSNQSGVSDANGSPAHFDPPTRARNVPNATATLPRRKNPVRVASLSDNQATNSERSKTWASDPNVGGSLVLGECTPDGHWQPLILWDAQTGRSTTVSMDRCENGPVHAAIAGWIQQHGLDPSQQAMDLAFKALDCKLVVDDVEPPPSSVPHNDLIWCSALKKAH